MDREFDLINRARAQAARLKAGSSAAAGDPARPAASRSIARDSFSGYHLSREIHRGGQGVVYLARQKNTGRDVAIKVMREGPFAGPGDRFRFEQEVRLLAELRHPNIVAIHDSGTSAGFFYFVMDYIAGEPLDEFVRNRKPSVADTLRLFARVCDAVSAAHLRGVIHRDLKPANIRVDERGEPHVLDFGLAKRTADGSTAARTQTGQFVGSLPWASPEQAEGRREALDLRTDVYSLGIVLYQLLTGQFPYSIEGSMREVLERIATAEPKRPHLLRPDVDADVETIVLKCLGKAPERRYQSAGELAADIRRYLGGLPIDARRDSALYVLRKTLRRHRVPAALATAFVVVVTGAAIALSVLYGRQRELRNQAEQQRTAAEQAQHLAERAAADARAKFSLARQTAEFMLTEVGNRLRYLPGGEKLRREMLEAAYERFSTLAAERSDDPAVQHALAQTCYRLAELAKELGHVDKAAEQLATARQRVTDLLVQSPDRQEYLALLAGICYTTATLAESRGDFMAADADMARGMEISRRLLDIAPDSAAAVLRYIGALDRVRARAERSGDQARNEELSGEIHRLAKRLVDLQPGDPSHRYHLSIAVGRLGDCHRLAGRLDQARERYEEAMEIVEGLVEEHPTNLNFYFNLSFLYERLSAVAAMGGDKKSYPRWTRERHEVLEKMLKLSPDNAQVRASYAGSCDRLAIIAAGAKRFEEAERLHREALAIHDDLISRDANNREWLAGRVSCVVQLGRLAQARHDVADARAKFEDALATHARIAGGAPVALETANALAACNTYLAELDEQAGDLKQAVKRRLEADRFLQRCVQISPNPPNSEWARNAADGCERLAALYRKLNDDVAAAQFERQTRDWKDRIAGRRAGASQPDRSSITENERTKPRGSGADDADAEDTSDDDG